MAKTIRVEDAVSAVKAASTMEEVKAVLEGFTKALIVEVHAQMHDGKLPIGWKKGDQISAFVRAEEDRREAEAFKALTVEEKIQKLSGREYNVNIAKISYCTEAELEEMAELLGAELDADKMRLSRIYALQCGVNKALMEAHCKEDKPIKEKVSYAEVKAAYTEYNIAQDDHERHTDNADLKAIADAAFGRYIDVLTEYGKSPSPEQEEVKQELIKKFGGCGGWTELGDLKSLSSSTLIEMSHKAGIHADWVDTRRHDMAVRLLRWAGIECDAETYAEEKERIRREEISRLNALIAAKRSEYLVLSEALRELESSKNYEALRKIKERVKCEYREIRLESWRFHQDHPQVA